MFIVEPLKCIMLNANNYLHILDLISKIYTHEYLFNLKKKES